MKLDVHVLGRHVAKLYRAGDEYVLKYQPGTPDDAFVSLAMPVREEGWRWPRDLHPFFRQNLREGHLLGVIRELFGPLMDGTDLSLLAVVGAAGIGRVAVTAEGAAPGMALPPLSIKDLLTAENTAPRFEELVRASLPGSTTPWSNNYVNRQWRWAMKSSKRQRTSRNGVGSPSKWCTPGTTACAHCAVQSSVNNIVALKTRSPMPAMRPRTHR